MANRFMRSDEWRNRYLPTRLPPSSLHWDVFVAARKGTSYRKSYEATKILRTEPVDDDWFDRSRVYCIQELFCTGGYYEHSGSSEWSLSNRQLDKSTSSLWIEFSPLLESGIYHHGLVGHIASDNSSSAISVLSYVTSTRYRILYTS